MKNQVFNPYLPQWEFIPDGEPHVFDNRVYIYGSHDRFNGEDYCQNDYVCYSAPTDDLSDWKYEGVIYRKTDDPKNSDGKMNLYAPDVCMGVDGRYYLYYVCQGLWIVSVAVCDTPAGKYEFLGYVCHKNGTYLGKRDGDYPQFDPAVLVEDGKVYLYTGFCMPDDTSVKGSQATVLDEDMLTVIQMPKILVPSKSHGKGTSFEGHEFFEASSIRKIGDKYYFVYSSILFHELCYAVSESPTGDFTYGGTIVSACDVGIDTYKPADMEVAWADNNHGGIVCIEGQWFVFYHRHTNRHSYSRQGCAEPIVIDENGKIRQMTISSCGLNSSPLKGKGKYPAYIACHLFLPGGDKRAAPYLTMDTPDGMSGVQYVASIKNSAVIGFRSFEFMHMTKITVWLRGDKGSFEIATQWNGQAVGKIHCDKCEDFTPFEASVSIPNGVHDLYFRYKGKGRLDFLQFEIE